MRRRAAGGRPRQSARGANQRDAGLARERTKLAWVRSSIAFLGVGAAILKFRPIAGIVILAIAPAVWLLGRTVRGRRQWPASRRTLLVTVAISALALVSLVLTLAGPSSRGLHR
jgi:uncharacterized membrane protein YidH (DUF202 family)